MIAETLNRTKDYDDSTPARTAFASFLIQQSAGRDWSAQEVAHVNNRLPTVISSHTYVTLDAATRSNASAAARAGAVLAMRRAPPSHSLAISRGVGRFKTYSVGEKAKVRTDLELSMPDHTPATEMTAWHKYLKRAEYLVNASLCASQRTLLPAADRAQLPEEKRIMAASLACAGLRQAKLRAEAAEAGAGAADETRACAPA